MEIRGTEYAIANTSDTALLPMLTCLQVAETEEYNKASEDSAIAQQISMAILTRLSDPSNHRKLAYSLKAAMPTLPDSLVKYRTFLHSDGREEVEFSFGLSSDELVGAIAAIMEARQPAKDAFGLTKVEVEEIQAEERRIAIQHHEKEQRKAELLRELTLLDQT